MNDMKAMDALIMDPLKELFGICTEKGGSPPKAPQQRPRIPARYFASAPAELTPPPLHPSTSSRGTTSTYTQRAAETVGDNVVEEVTPEWALPHLTRPTPSRIIRGLSPIQAGAARAIPAPEPVKRHPTEKATALDYDTTYDSQRSQNSNDQEASQPIQESPPDVCKLETPTLLNSSGTPPDTDFDAGETNDADGHAQEEALQTLSGMPPEPAPALPEHDIRTFLQPLPPGWVQNQGFSVGLHPTTDVFELDDDAPRLPAHEEEGDTNPASGKIPRMRVTPARTMTPLNEKRVRKAGKPSRIPMLGRLPHARRAAKNFLMQK